MYQPLSPYMRRRLAAQQRAKCLPPKGFVMEQYVDESGNRVTARQFTQDSITVISVWCHAEIAVEHDALDYEMTFQALTVPTNDGPKRASQGDYIVRLADGSFDVRKAYEFRSKFREV